MYIQKHTENLFLSEITQRKSLEIMQLKFLKKYLILMMFKQLIV